MWLKDNCLPENINDVEFSVFDLETTGLEPELGERIVEIAAIKQRGKQRTGVFQSLLNPKREISSEAFSVNRITSEMLKDAPSAGEILPKFLDFISGSCLASYNAPFDLGFLENEVRLIGRSLSKEILVVDVLTMARRLLPNLGSYALWSVAQSLGIKTLQEHRALSDVELTLEVFNQLNSRLEESKIVRFEQFISLFGLNSKLRDDINNAKIARIQEALDRGVSIKIKYLTRRNAELTERKVIPRAIIEDKNYLVGFCTLRNEERTFKIENILHLEISL